MSRTGITRGCQANQTLSPSEAGRRIHCYRTPYSFGDPSRCARRLPYRFDPNTDGFIRSNGIAFSPDGSTALVTDSALHGGFLGNDQTTSATIYAHDVDPKTDAFANRRVFAYVDTGVADGIQLDAAGNVYAACGEGIHVWGPEGTLLGKFFVGAVSPDFIPTTDGRLVILAETTIFFADIAAKFNRMAFP